MMSAPFSPNAGGSSIGASSAGSDARPSESLSASLSMSTSNATFSPTPRMSRSRGSWLCRVGWHAWEIEQPMIALVWHCRRCGKTDAW